MSHATRIDRARGCLLGLAVGDALGAPLEGLSTQQIKAVYGQVSDYVDGARAWRKKPYRWRLRGLYTDDTQQALALADCLRERGVIDPDWLARLYVAMATPRDSYLGAHRSAGKTFRLVVGDLERGMSPELTGRTSAGIGAAMRIAPLGVYYSDRPEELLEAVLAASLMTHRDIRSLAGAVAVATAVAQIVRAGPEARRPSLLFQVAHTVRRAESAIADKYSDRVTGLERYRHVVSNGIAAVEPVLEQSREHAYSALIEHANRSGAEPACTRPTMGFPPVCIPTCLYLLLVNDTLEDALIEVVNLGGDADTCGAILGAMSGALHGESAIPKTWLEQLCNQTGITLRADALADPATAREIPDLNTTERELTAREAEARDALMALRQSEDDLGANRRR
jgi:ADP-ribosylglycohydrolase